ncbi:MAG: hypothetical protein V2A71_06105 [Candidatus Eisenbacteria bacterium]
MRGRSEVLLICSLLAGFLAFLVVCSCEKGNVIEPADFFDIANSYDPNNPDFWPVCLDCGAPSLLAPVPELPASAAPPGGEFVICTGPNPTSGPFCIRYELKSEADVLIIIFSEKAEKVITLVREHRLAGTYHHMWELTDDTNRLVENGRYRAFFKAGNYETHGDIIVKR